MAARIRDRMPIQIGNHILILFYKTEYVLLHIHITVLHPY